MRFPRFAQAAVAIVAVASLSLLVARSTVLAAPGLPAQAPASAPQAAPPAPGSMPPHFPAPNPTNLMVLPSNLTGDQVHEIMHKWADELGTKCTTCHTADPKNLGPNGRPRINFADDSKQDKQTARKMYKMTQEINANYISKIDSSAPPVTCGTCHRGHVDPEAFIPAPDDDHDHDHGGPPPPGAKPPAGQ